MMLGYNKKHDIILFFVVILLLGILLTQEYDAFQSFYGGSFFSNGLIEDVRWLFREIFG